MAVLLLCLAGGLVGVAATGSADAAAGETELTGERALNTTGPDPGETVRVTTTVTREGEGAIDYLDTFDPEFESSELVSVTEGGEEISESLKGMFPDTIFVVAEEVGPEVVEFVYDITVPADASHGETFTFGGTVQTDEANATVGGVSSFTVGGEPFFAVDLDPVESVTVGEDLAVEATVTNTGDGGGEGSVAFAVDGEEQASTPVELDGGESQTVAFEYATTAADTPEIDVAVSSADETDSTSVEVLRPAAFDVGLESLPESVGVGEDLAVEATVTNTGDETGTQAVTFTVNEGIEGSQDLTLDGGESEPVLFEYATTAADAPEVEVAVSSANETATATVGVAELAAFEVAFESVPASVGVGETIAVEAVVTNTGEETGTQTVSFTVDGETEGSQHLTLDGGESETVEFGYTTTEEDPPEVEVVVSSANETDSTGIEVQRPAVFEVAFESPLSATPVGEDLVVEAVVTNTGDESGTQTVTFTVDGAAEGSQNLTLDGGESETVTFEYATTDADVPELEVGVSSDNETVTETVGVVEGPFFDVTLDPVESAVVGEDLAVEATVTNTGDETGTQTVTFTADGVAQGSQNLTLAGGESETVVFEYTTTEADPPEVDVAVSSGDETDSTGIEVQRPATFEVAFESPLSATPVGEDFAVEAVVTNTGDESGTQAVTFTVNGETEGGQNLTLDGGESKTVEFGYTTTEADAPEVEVGVSSANETATATVGVVEGPFFAVDLEPVESVTVGEILLAEAVVTNTGEETGTQTVTFVVDGATEGSRELTLDGGESETVTFEYATTDADTPEVAVGVSSGNETATAGVAVAEQAQFEVELSPTEAVPAGDDLSVEATVTNTGGATDTQQVTVTVGGSPVADREVTLDGGESETVSVGYTTTEADTPEVDIAVATADVIATGTVTVLEPAALAVTAVTVDEPVVAGEDLVVEYTVENTGAVEATRTVILDVDGETVATDTVTLAGGERETVTTTHPTAEGGVTLDLTVTTDHDSESVQVAVGAGDDTGGNETGSDDETGAGFGLVAAVLGLGVLCLFARSRTSATSL